MGCIMIKNGECKSGQTLCDHCHKPAASIGSDGSAQCSDHLGTKKASEEPKSLREMIPTLTKKIEK